MSDKNVESMLERFTWRILANHVSPWELEQVKSRIGCWDDWCAEFSRLAQEHVSIADEAAAAGRNVTAGNAYVRAASIYHWASFYYEVVLRAVIDHISRRQDIDASRLAVGGISYGGLFACRAAAFDERVRAAVSVSAWYTPAGLHSHMPQLGKIAIGQYFGPNPAEVQNRITMAGAAERITVPLLQVYGGRDKASPPSEAYRVEKEVKGPCRTVVFEDGVHVCNNVQNKARPLIADWLAQQFGK